MIKGLEMRWSWMIWEDPYLSEGADEDGGRAWSAVATCQEHQESQKLTRQKGPSHRASGVPPCNRDFSSMRWILDSAL